MRSALIFLLSSLLVFQTAVAQESANGTRIEQIVAELPANAHVAIHLTSGNTVRGHVASAGDNNFVLRPDDRSSPQTIAYAQVSSVDQIKGHSTKKWIIIGVVAAVAVVGTIAAVVAFNHKY